jgi:hypothetical protein
MSNEELAQRIGNSKTLLRKRLAETRSCLDADIAKMFRPGVFDFERKRLVSNCGKYCLQWKVRQYPEKPTDYNNQQTSTGYVRLVEVFGK